MVILKLKVYKQQRALQTSMEQTSFLPAFSKSRHRCILFTEILSTKVQENALTYESPVSRKELFRSQSNVLFA